MNLTDKERHNLVIKAIDSRFRDRSVFKYYVYFRAPHTGWMYSPYFWYKKDAEAFVNDLKELGVEPLGEIERERVWL